MITDHTLIQYFLLALLPVAAWSGWWVARRHYQRGEGKHGRGIHPEYFKGLNYVLNEQPDKAIEVFIKMLEVDSETVETHLALGNLFRRRGEVDRAIRIHQNLIARPTLDREQRALALLELGMDYMRSGLLDRAESLFEELVETGSYSVQAFRELLDIYQQEKEWDKCITTARRLETTSGERLDPVVAQYYCEKAEELRDQGQHRPARDNIRRALAIDPNCARASFLEAELAQLSGKLRHALRAYKRIEKQDPEYMPEVIPLLLDCYRQLDKLDECTAYLRDVLDRDGGITTMLTLTDLIAQREGEEAAAEFITSELRKRPSVRGLERLIAYALEQAEGRTRESLITIRELTAKLLENRPVYKCYHCGFVGKSLHWQCPSCKQWNTIKPIHGVEGE
ncbi:lipopolysaccharide biosynthesis regulator YciM [Methylohalomonas lacus]|uniref:Lipopolysaccharide assembly protein B n=1 Tax=Methylohalomonas lacus TaxID=398773 RepID=A0AAE3L4X1_9GAMM|nr:lipopolysaccharide assembly protein LapB [Methylohalomonas lacus]MCS3902292.1 lipopolysaccharide biosynthesis regulator YciM [Methylohalomonas lacus]